MLRVSTMPIIASFRKALVAVDGLYPTRSTMLVNTTGPPLGCNLASVAITSGSLYARLLAVSFIAFVVTARLLSRLLDDLMAVDAARLVADAIALFVVARQQQVIMVPCWLTVHKPLRPVGVVLPALSAPCHPLCHQIGKGQQVRRERPRLAAEVDVQPSRHH